MFDLLNPAKWSKETREFAVMAITIVATVLTNAISSTVDADDKAIDVDP